MTMLKIRVLMEDTLQAENVECPSGYSHILFNAFVLTILIKISTIGMLPTAHM